MKRDCAHCQLDYNRKCKASDVKDCFKNGRYTKFVPMGGHKPGDCSVCEKRNTCQELCEEAEVYVGQDYVPQKEITISNDFLDSKEQLNMPECNIPTSHKLVQKILELHRDGMSQKQITYHLPCSKQYVSRVLLGR